MKTSYGAFSEDAVTDNIRQRACTLFVTAVGEGISVCSRSFSVSSASHFMFRLLSGFTPCVTLSRSSFFLSPHPLQLNISPYVPSCSPSVLPPSPLSRRNGQRASSPHMTGRCSPCKYCMSLKKTKKPLPPLSSAKQRHRNSALFPVTYFSIHAVFHVYQFISSMSACQGD